MADTARRDPSGDPAPDPGARSRPPASVALQVIDGLRDPRGALRADEPAAGRLVALLERLDALGEHTGRVGFSAGGRRAGFAVLNRGKLVLVGGTAQHVRLGELLAREAPDLRDRLRRAVVEARREGRPLGRVLARSGPQIQAPLKAALQQQIVSGLVELTRLDAPLEVEAAPLRAVSEDLPPSFSLAEILLAAFREARRDLTGRAPELFREFRGTAQLGVLMHVGDGRPLVLDAHGPPLDALETLGKLGAAVSQVMAGPAPFAADGPPRLMLLSGHGDTTVTLRDGPCTALLGGLGRPQLARLMGRAL